MAIKQRSKSLLSRENDLSNANYQLTVLNDADLMDDQFVPFLDQIANHGYNTLKPATLEIFKLTSANFAISPVATVT